METCVLIIIIIVNLFLTLFFYYVPLCHKCKQQKQDNELRTYHLVLRNNINPNSYLSRLDKVNLCFACDGARKTNIVQYLDNNG